MAVVRESLVGSNTYIATNAAVELSVIGEGCVLQGSAVVQYSVMYPGAFTFAKGVNVSFLGRDTFIGDAAALTDFRFDGGSVAVWHDGRTVDTGYTVLGCCVGHGAYLGSGCVVAPGRAIPNGSRLCRDETHMIYRFGPDGGAQGYRRVTPRAARSNPASDK
jgi:carbonic anhydrase/acetyltransferase-like protein (isoleucine patch superfamily)